MPNHCHNRVTIYGSGNDTDETRAQIAKLKQIFEDENTFGQIIPEPDWVNTPLMSKDVSYWLHDKRGEVGELPVDGRFPSTDRQDDRWYDWRLKHWGTKWPACEVKITKDDSDYLEVTFDTAWCPPEEICQALRSKYENKSEESYSNGLFISVNWFYELEGEEGCGYL